MKKEIVALVAILHALSGTGVAAAQPTMHPRKLVSYGPEGMPVNETAVAVDAVEPSRMVAMWNIDQNGSGGAAHWRMGYAYSTDGGMTWTDDDGSGNVLLFPIPGVCQSYGIGPADPGLVVDPASGRFVGTGLTGCFEGCATHALVHSARMEYGTQTFANQLLLQEGSGCGNYCCEPCFSDFPHTIVGQLPNQPGVYRQYIFGHSRGEQEIQCALSGAYDQLVVHSSNDGGVTWSSRSRVLRGDQPVIGKFVAPAIGGNGRVYVAYTTPDGATIKMVRSDDAGLTFADTALAQTRTYTDVGLGDVIAGQTSGNSNAMGCAVYPAADPSLDTVYLVYHDLAAPDSGGDGDLDVFLLRSFDGGDTWSCPIRVNNDNIETPYILSDQYYPAVCVDTAGRAHVVWYDTRNDPQSPGSHVKIDLFCARVDGQTGVPCEQVVFENWAANAEAIDTAWLIHNGQFKLGDYIAIAPIPNGAIAVYMGTNHPRSGFDFGGSNTDETIDAKRITWP